MSKKQVIRSGPYADLIAQGVKVGNVIYLSGQVGMDEKDQIPATITEQCALAYKNVHAVLAEFNASMDDIVDETVFVTDLEETHEELEAIFAARAEAYGGQPDVTQTLVAVSGLFLPALKLEIKCVAILDA